MLSTISAETAVAIGEAMGACLAVLGGLVGFYAICWGNMKLLKLLGRDNWD